MASRSPKSPLPVSHEQLRFSEHPALLMALPHSATRSYNSRGPAFSRPTSAACTTTSASGVRSSLFPTSLSDGCITQSEGEARWGDLYPSSTDVESDWSPPDSPKSLYSSASFAFQPQAARSNEQGQQPRPSNCVAEENRSPGPWLPVAGPSLAGGRTQADTGRQRPLRTDPASASGRLSPPATFALATGRTQVLPEAGKDGRPPVQVTSPSYDFPSNRDAHYTHTVFPSSSSTGSNTSGSKSNSSGAFAFTPSSNSNSSQWNASRASISPTASELSNMTTMKGKQRRGYSAAPISPSSQWHSTAGQKEVPMHPLERCQLAVKEMLQTSSAGAAAAASASRTPPATSSGHRNGSQGGFSAASPAVDSEQHRRSDKWKAALTPPSASGRPDHSQHSSRGVGNEEWRGRDRERRNSSSFSRSNSRREGSQSNPNIPLMPASPLPAMEVSSRHGQHPHRDPVLAGYHAMTRSRASLSPPPANLSPPGRAFAAGVETCLLLEKVNHVDQRTSTAVRSSKGGVSLRGPAAYVGAISPEASKGHVTDKGQRASASPVGRSNSTRSRHSYSSSASAIMASVSPRGMATVPRLFEQFALLTREAPKVRGPVDVAVTRPVSGRQRTSSSESTSRQGSHAEGRRSESAACYSDSGLGAVERSGQQQRGREKSRSKNKTRARSSNSESRSVTPQRLPATSHAAVILPGPLASADTRADRQVPMDRQLSSGRLGHNVVSRVYDRHADNDTEKTLDLAVRQMKGSARTLCSPGRSKTPNRSALKCSTKTEEFSVVRPRQVQFVNDGHT